MMEGSGPECRDFIFLYFLFGSLGKREKENIKSVLKEGPTARRDHHGSHQETRQVAYY